MERKANHDGLAHTLIFMYVPWGLWPAKRPEKPPHPTSSLGHLLPTGEGKKKRAGRARKITCPLRRGEGGGHAPPGEGSLSKFATRQQSDCRIRQTVAASSAEPGVSATE